MSLSEKARKLADEIDAKLKTHMSIRKEPREAAELLRLMADELESKYD